MYIVKLRIGEVFGDFAEGTCDASNTAFIACVMRRLNSGLKGGGVIACRCKVVARRRVKYVLRIASSVESLSRRNESSSFGSSVKNRC